MSDYLVVNNLSRRFGAVKALDGLSFSIPKNSVAAFVGANGAGKTTTFSIIAQYIKPQSGEVLVDSVPLTQFRREGGVLGLLPQDMQYFEDRSVKKQLQLFAELSGLSVSQAKKEVERVLEAVQLSDRANDKPGNLSRGMLVRLGVAQALIANPSLILLDEPTAGLDPKMVATFRDVIESLRGQATVVISSHMLSELQNMCDYVCIVDKGKLLSQGPMEDLLSGSAKVVFELALENFDLAKLQQTLTCAEFVLNGRKLTASFDPTNLQIDMLNKQVLTWLFENNVGVLQVLSARSLEETYLAATSKK